MEERVYMVIESLYDRMRECREEKCDASRRSLHHSMIRLETRLLLEILGEGENNHDQEELQRSVKNFAKTASTIFETFRAEVKLAEELYKKAKKVRRKSL